MLWAARIVSALVVLTLGFTWTVGQSGLQSTNKNLCELWASVSPWPYQTCEVQWLLLIIWGLGAALVAGFLLFDIARLFRRRGLFNRFPATMTLGLILLALSLVGIVVSLTLIAKGSKQKSAGIGLASIGLKPPNGVRIQDEVIVGSMAVAFLNIGNSEGKDTLFKRSHSLLPNGRQIERRMSFHKFYVAVDNKSKARTLRDVRVVIDQVRGPVGGIISHALLCDRTGTETADIPPGGHDFFVIGEAVDASDAGMFRPKVVSSAEYDRALAYAENLEKHSVGFMLHSSGNKKIQLLRNNGYRLEITAYADDNAPVKAVLILNTKPLAELWLTAEKHIA